MASNNKNEIDIKQQNELTKVSKLSNMRKHHACDVCGKIFNSKKLLANHYGSNHKNYIAAQQKIQVPLLEKQFRSDHKNAQHENPTCGICFKTFTYKDNLKRHLLNIHEEKKKVPCENCDKFFSCKDYLKQHYNQSHLNNPKSAKVHQESTKIECNFCGKMVFYLKAHIKNCHEDNMVKCPKCEKDIRSRNVKKHFKSNCQNRDSQLNLKMHMKKEQKAVTMKKLIKVKCSVCEKNVINLEKHKFTCRAVKRNVKPHKCDNCEKSFKHRHHLTRHKKIVHGHKKVVHDKIQDHKCNLCGKEFRSTDSIKRHISEVHDKVKKI